MLSPRRLASIIGGSAAIPHIEMLRVHSRVPVADPERVTEALADALDDAKSMWVVLHANHAREFTTEASVAIRRVQAAHAGAGPVGAAARRERQRGGTGGAVPRHAGGAGEALLPAPARPRPRHRALPRADRGGPRLLAQLRGRVTGWHGRPTCWISRAATERCRSGRTIWNRTKRARSRAASGHALQTPSARRALRARKAPPRSREAPDTASGPARTVSRQSRSAVKMTALGCSGSKIT